MVSLRRYTLSAIGERIKKKQQQQQLLTILSCDFYMACNLVVQHQGHIKLLTFRLTSNHSGSCVSALEHQVFSDAALQLNGSVYY